MNIFETLRRRSASSAVDAGQLPTVNDFVDVAAGGKTDTVCVESIAKAEIETRCPSKAAVGVSALFNYSTTTGRFRLRTQCVRIDDGRAFFALPGELTIIEKFGDKRRSFRLRKLVDVSWRYAPDGVGNGPLVRGRVVDLSPNGACLDIGRELRQGTLIEIRFEPITVDGQSVVCIAELTRPAQKNDKGIVAAGLHFRDLRLSGQNAISEFIHQYEKQDRRRHLAR